MTDGVVTAARDATRQAVRALFAAIESRDLPRIGRALAADCTWQNVPHPPAVGTAEVLALLAPVLRASDRVNWAIATESFGDGVAWVERADRFWIDGEEHTVRCNGVFTVDVGAGVVTGVRDYVDLGEWRSRIVPALDRVGRAGHRPEPAPAPAPASGQVVGCSIAQRTERTIIP